MNWMDKLSRTDECVKIGTCKINRLLFVDLVLLAFFESGFQHALNGFARACETAWIKISTSKTEVLHLSRNSVQYFLQVGVVLLKQVEKFVTLRKKKKKKNIAIQESLNILSLLLRIKRSQLWMVWPCVYNGLGTASQANFIC